MLVIAWPSEGILSSRIPQFSTFRNRASSLVCESRPAANRTWFTAQRRSSSSLGLYKPRQQPFNRSLRQFLFMITWNPFHLTALLFLLPHQLESELSPASYFSTFDLHDAPVGCLDLATAVFLSNASRNKFFFRPLFSYQRRQKVKQKTLAEV